MTLRDLRFAWLEITGKCQLSCEHCYADSSPAGSHGSLVVDDWLRVIDQLAGAGVRTVQFIGGEPILHPGLQKLLEHVLACGLQAEVFSNLVHVPSGLWPVFERAGVSLATSYYSDDPGEHAAITGRRSHARTVANISEAVRREIPIRVGVINVRDKQRSIPAQAELVALGVREIRTDRLRQVGRGVRDRQPAVSELCGRCASGVIAISPNGEVWPCVFSRWLPIGNVLDAELSAILSSAEADRVRDGLRAEFATRPGMAPCVPTMCDPGCGPSCSPACTPKGDCRPAGGCAPDYY
ncbi:radical SAM protein [Amycolatopsis nigrescens]|uniref:radical SAM protein n=1 Tax=Amycolatopsis nigrescens TaxID=381445 RepID=UPI001FDEB80D|nr:radical SAM protein [Amycolatopsis nigrescens]